MLSNIKLLFSLFAINIKSRAMLRGEFLLRCSLMALNNFMFLIIWGIFFKRYDSINGWSFSEFLLMMGVVHIAFGANSVLFNGLKKIPLWVESGNFDVFFIYPRNVLLMASTADSDPWGFSDIFCGVVMIIMSGLLENTI